MSRTLIDLRSDTVTLPTDGMRAAMLAAPVGDDVFDEDPTVQALQNRVANMLGKEAALFVPTGTMANQICIRAHTQPGDELICDSTAHVYVWEAGGPATLSGVTTRTVAGDHGLLHVNQLRDLIRPRSMHYAQTRLVSLENTHNRGGGRVYAQSAVRDICAWAHANGLTTHLDGARIWNAHVASGIALPELCASFDCVSVCFSKGLGAPIGSAVVGSGEFIAKSKWIRKLFGGAWRQAGMLAAAANYALDHHIDRLADDHRHAKIIAAAIANSPGLRVDPLEIETNLVWFEVEKELSTAQELSNALHELGIIVHIAGPSTLRICTHLNVSAAQAAASAEIIESTTRRLRCRTR